MDLSNILIVILVLAWVVYRQYVGRFVSLRRGAVIPAILVVLGLNAVVSAHPTWTATAVGFLAGSLVLTAVLGLVRGAAIRLTVVDGYLYQRGGMLSVGLWVVSIAARVLVEVFAHGTSAATVMTASIMLSFGVSLAAQAAVLTLRVKADGRPLRQADRRGDRASATLGR